MEEIASLIELLASLLGAGLLTTVGLLTENAGLADTLAGPSVFGLWELGMGLLLLYAGVYMLGYKRVWLEVRARRAN